MSGLRGVKTDAFQVTQSASAIRQQRFLCRQTDRRTDGRTDGWTTCDGNRPTSLCITCIARQADKTIDSWQP